MGTRSKITAVISMTFVIMLFLLPVLNSANEVMAQPPTQVLTESPMQSAGNLFSEPIGMVSTGILPDGSSYQYNTTSFLATVVINSLYVENYSSVFHQNDMTFQLNAVITFQVGNVIFSYWSQNVAELDTESHGIYFFDNIWNLSSPDARMLPNSVTGNGSVSDLYGFFTGEYFYEDSASYFASGNDIDLNYPATVQLKTSVSISSNGYPELIFQYNDGPGWITYDNAYFFSNHTSYPTFHVGGYQYTGYGLQYNAGIIMGGYGNGASTDIIFSNVTMSLQYWNGFNYQAPITAVDYGADTAESVSNANVTLSSLNGLPAAHVSYGNETLGTLYGNSDVSNVYLNSVNPGSFLLIFSNESVNSYSVSDFAHFVFSPGMYNLTLITPLSYSVSTSYLNISLSPGKTYYYSTFYLSYSGLPDDKPFNVTLTYSNETHSYSISGNKTFLLPIGQINLKILPVSYFASNIQHENIEITQEGETANLTFSPVGYLTGEVLPLNAQVYINGTRVNVNDGQFNVSLGSGNYTITVSSPGYYQTQVVVSVKDFTTEHISIHLNRNYTGYIILGTISVMASIGLGIAVFLKRRSKI